MDERSVHQKASTADVVAPDPFTCFYCEKVLENGWIERIDSKVSGQPAAWAHGPCLKRVCLRVIAGMDELFTRLQRHLTRGEATYFREEVGGLREQLDLGDRVNASTACFLLRIIRCLEGGGRMSQDRRVQRTELIGKIRELAAGAKFKLPSRARRPLTVTSRVLRLVGVENRRGLAKA